MKDTHSNAGRQIAPPASHSFYVTGGTLRADAPSYVERQADKDLYESLLDHEFSYVLTSRQMGKSSLMVRTSQKLREKGARVIALDLTAIGQNLTAEQWYDGLLLRIGRALDLEDEVENYWKENPRVGPCQRLFAALGELVLPRCSQASSSAAPATGASLTGSLFIFVDEIDTVRSLPFSTDEFFAAIRECYNRRPEEPQFMRLTFCLLGVATPSDLISNARTTPFNIGRRIELTDFTAKEVEPLTRGIRHGEDGIEDMSQEEACLLLERILHWTGGHPYLTQKLCREVAERNDSIHDQKAKLHHPKAIDQLCAELFFSVRARERDDNLLFVRQRLLRSDVDRAALLDLYLKVLRGDRVPDDETNVHVAVLRLSGLVRVEKFLVVRNAIYKRVFDRAWVMANTPDAEKIRQREAFRRGLRRGAAVGAVFLVASALLSWTLKQKYEHWDAATAVDKIGERFQSIETYEDESEIREELQMLGRQVIGRTTLKVALQKPDKLHISANLSAPGGELGVEVIRNGTNLWISVPSFNIYSSTIVTNSLSETFAEASRWIGAELDETSYRLIASRNPELLFAREARNIQFLGQERLDDQTAYLLRWHRPLPQSEPPAGRRSRQQVRATPVTVWVDRPERLVRQMSVDFTGIRTNTWIPSVEGSAPSRVSTKQYLLISKHFNVRVNQPISGDLFQFRPTTEARELEEIDTSALMSRPPVRGDLSSLKPDPARLITLIPSRAPQTPPELIDLTSFYNAALTENWHSDLRGNDLARLPRGRQRFGEVEFDARGIIQLAGTTEGNSRHSYPGKVSGIVIGRLARRLHFLHGTGWSAKEGAQIGQYLIHYSDGRRRSVPILYGYDVRNWWPEARASDDSTTGSIVAWRGRNRATGDVRLYRTSWVNPLPGVEIAKIDFVSSVSSSAPFLIAITAEP